MNIVLSGVETNNKGAELMLYSILQEIEVKYPDAKVYVSVGSVKQGLNYLKTNVDVRYKSFEKFNNLLERFKVKRILSKLGVYPIFFKDIYTLKRVDYFIDGSGLRFSDKMSASTKQEARRWEILLRRNKKAGAKIIFLPQAFGPFEKQSTRDTLATLNTYSDVIFSREPISTQYLAETALVDMHKVYEYPDFTALVDGICLPQYSEYINGICIIPNIQMADQGIMTMETYINYIKIIIDVLQNKGEKVFILNHQGKRDEMLGYKIIESFEGNIPFITGINALEVKGIISKSKLVITSRFHGAVSALNSCVPCLATSWSHKYEELFRTYNQHNCVLPVSDIEKSIQMISEFINPDYNQCIRTSLVKPVEKVKSENRKMWDMIWNL